MSERQVTATALTHLAIDAVERGNLDDARAILAEALALDTGYAPAWLWFAHVAQDDSERAFCLHRAGGLDPGSIAGPALGALAGVTPSCPPELRALIEPPLPPSVRPVSEAPSPRRGRWAWIAMGLVILAVLALGFAWRHRTAAVSAVPVHLAFVADLTGPSAQQVEIMRKSVQLRLDQANAAGGIDGRPVELLLFDDQGTVPGAVAAAEAIASDDRIMLVIGHRISGPSLAAAGVYREAGIPSISPTSTSDEVTAVNPWGFRTIFDNSRQGVMMAAAIANILESDRITVIQDSGLYGKTLSESVRTAFSGVVNPTVPYPDEAAAAQAAAAIAAMEDPGTIVLGIEPAGAKALIVALRDAGITAPMISGNSIATDAFLESFADLPAEVEDPGHYTEGLATVAPLFIDSLSGNGLRWLNEFEARYGETPSWRGATSYDAAGAAVHAIDAADISGLPSTADRRREIRNALAALDRPESAIPGVVGPIWFDSLRTVPQRMSLGLAEEREFKSAPLQFDAYRPTGIATLQKEIAAGNVVSIDGNLLQKQRIVYVGLTVNSIGALNLTQQTFQADFFLWFSYVGDDAPVDIAFNNAADPMLALGEPIRVERGDDGLTYQLFRVNSTFKAPLQFRDFPFDQQVLPIQFQNRTLPIGRIVYVIDGSIVDQAQQERLTSSVDRTRTISEIPNWHAMRVDLYQKLVGSTSALGDPKATAASSGVEYSAFAGDIAIGRDISSYLVKNLLPLALLAVVTYVALFVPPSETGVQVSLGVAGVLTGAVLLTEVTGSLPDIGYTVAIEWAYYAAILLAMASLIVCLTGNRLAARGHHAALSRLQIASRIGYPALIVAVVAAYWVRYGG